MEYFGALQYPAARIMSVLAIDDKESFLTDFTTPGHLLFEAYLKGFNSGSFNIDSKLFDLAQNGDVDAIKALQERNQAQRVNVLISEYLGGTN